MDSQETQYERLMVALDDLRARFATILAEAWAVQAESVAIRAESARILGMVERPAVPETS